MILYEPITITIVILIGLFFVFTALGGVFEAIGGAVSALLPIVIFIAVVAFIAYLYNEYREKQKIREAEAKVDKKREEKDKRDKDTLDEINQAAALENLEGYFGEIRRGLRLIDNGVEKSQVVDAIDAALNKIKSDTTINNDLMKNEKTQKEAESIVSTIKEKGINDAALFRRFDFIFK